MPYPVLPPPPPPIVSNEVSLQPPILETVANDDVSGLDVQGNTEAIRSPNVPWASCLASPERLPSEFSSPTDGQMSGPSAQSSFFCAPPQPQSPSLLPLTPQGHSQPSPILNGSGQPLAHPQEAEDKANALWHGRIPENADIVEELNFVIDTSNTDAYPLDLRQLAQDRGQSNADIFTIPLGSSEPLVPQLRAQLDPRSSDSSLPNRLPGGGSINGVPLDIEVLESVDPNSLDPDSLVDQVDQLLSDPNGDPVNISPDSLDSDTVPLSNDGVSSPDLDIDTIDSTLEELEVEPPDVEMPPTLSDDALPASADDLPDVLPNGISDTIDGALDDTLDAPARDALDDLISDPEEPETSPEPNDSADEPALTEPLDSAGEDALEVTADRQVYDRNRQYFVAEGNALMTFRGSLLKADTLRVNLVNQIVVAEGNAILTRGEQVIRGNRLEYNLVQDEGIIYDAKGEVFLPQTSSDFGPDRPDTLETSSEVPLTDRLATDQPVVTASSPGGVSLGVGFSGGQGNSSRQGAAAGSVSRIRFEADEITFRPDGWDASNVRLTNDPFSPPELEIRSRLVTFRRLDANRSELRARRPRLVLDQGLQIPLLRERAIFDSRDRNPAPFQIGFDEDDRGGLFIQRSFSPIANEIASLTLTPQFFIQQALENDDGVDETPPDLEDSSSWFDPDLYGLLGELDVRLGSKTALSGSMTLTSLDFGDNVSEEDLRGNVRLRRKIDTGLGPHILTSEYSYRDRLFNGTLGFQTVQKSYGIVLTSPRITLGDSGIQLTYQGGIQRVNANIAPDRIEDLLPPPPRPNNRDTLMRYQVAADLRRTYFLWQGKPLPATQNEGLRYTPNPVVPFIALTPSVRGVASFYSSGDDQPILTGQLALSGQFGHFSRPYLDYLGFNLTYRHSTEGSESPFNFDRVADRQVVSGGITTQLFGPVRVGFRTSVSLDEDEEFDNSFILEYSRRTHGVVLRYNPDRQIGSIGLRISDFNWNGTPEPFGGSGVRTVDDGVLRND